MKEFNLKMEEVQRINISAFPSCFKEFDIADEEQVYNVVDYLNSLNTIETKLNPSDYYGGGYSIRIYLRNGSTREFMLSCNKFFMEKNRFTYEVPYKEAIKFDTIIANILEDNENRTGASAITGTIISVIAEASGHDISCIIKDKDNTIYNINVEHANIIDATGNGWMILHKEDIVKIFYQKDNQTDKDTINALTVYIKTAAK